MEAAQLRNAITLMEGGDWSGAHKIVQEDEESALACWAHGIVHVMEGDEANARYWYAQAKRAFPVPYSVTSEIRDLKRQLLSTD